MFDLSDLSDENKDYIPKGIIKGTLELMESTIISQTLPKRSKRFTKPRFQSKNVITKDTIQYNILARLKYFQHDPEILEKVQMKKKEILINMNYLIFLYSNFKESHN